MEKSSLRYVNIFLVVMIVLLVLFGIIMFAYQRERYSDTFFNYNGFEVHKVSLFDRGFVYKISLVSLINNKLYSIESRYNPKELEEIPVNIDLDDIYNKETLFITMDKNATAISVLAATEISKVTGNSLIFRYPISDTFGALKEPVEGKNVTVMTCNNVSENIGVISFEINNKSEIYSNNGCVILSGKNENDLIRVADRLMLVLLGIMKP
ncbi:MAG: hypothetical protein AABX29_07835 [Nanoarchaeota archaeon]